MYLFAGDESVAAVAGWAGADGALGAGAVVARGALGVRAARVRLAEVACGILFRFYIMPCR